MYSGKSTQTKLELATNSNPDSKKIPENVPYLLQTAIRCSLDEFYFNVPIMFSTLFTPQNMKMNLDNYKSMWTSIQTTQEMCYVIQNLNNKFQSSQNIINRLESNFAYLIHRIENNGQGKYNV